jgi:hypothetical protein
MEVEQMAKGAAMRIQSREAAPKDEDINRRAIEAVDALGVMNPMRQATIELAKNWSYEEAAKAAGVTPEVVREWTEDPDFVMAIGWAVVGLADNE